MARGIRIGALPMLVASAQTGGVQHRAEPAASGKGPGRSRYGTLPAAKGSNSTGHFCPLFPQFPFAPGFRLTN